MNPRILKFDHKVKISSTTSGPLFIEWNGFQGRHDYFMTQNIEDLDILISELEMAKTNYVRKRVIKI